MTKHFIHSTRCRPWSMPAHGIVPLSDRKRYFRKDLIQSYSPSVERHAAWCGLLGRDNFHYIGDSELGQCKEDDVGDEGQVEEIEYHQG